MFCHQINEVGDDLGMLQAISRPPSKPIAPGDEFMVAVRSWEIKHRLLAFTFCDGRQDK